MEHLRISTMTAVSKLSDNINLQNLYDSLNINDTVKQINQLTEAGVDIVRVSCPDRDSSLAL